MFEGPFQESIIKRAIAKGIVDIQIVNIRDFAEDKHKMVDDTPYGGGAGMVLKVDVMDRAIEKITGGKRKQWHKILLTPQGKTYRQDDANRLIKHGHLLLICGHYEGFDERIRQYLIDEQISIGTFVLSGGEIPAMAVVDSIVRLLPGALGKDESTEEESFSIEHNGEKLLEYPHYTKPFDHKGWKVPEILLSGNHAEIKKWRFEEAIKRTKRY